MAKIFGKITFTTVVILATINFLYAQKSNSPGLYFSDSLGNNTVEYYDANNTDLLQEALYQRLKTRINNPVSAEKDPVSKTRFQFLQKLSEILSTSLPEWRDTCHSLSTGKI